MIVLEWLFLTIAPCDAAEPWQLGSQDAATPMMQGIMDLHHDIFFFLILILVFVSRMLVRALWHFHYQTNPIPQRIVHGTTIEILRTIFPVIRGRLCLLRMAHYLSYEEDPDVVRFVYEELQRAATPGAYDEALRRFLNLRQGAKRKKDK
nr:TPA_asm: hypothetical protein HUJ06_027093 [Nelumbo nucifera]